MIKKTITYKDFDDIERTEDFYFHFTRAEVAEMELSESGGLGKMLQRIVSEQNATKLIGVFKSLVIDSYGEKSPDGRRFIKTPEVKAAFIETEAFSQIFMELAENSDKAVEFINNVITNIKK